MQRYIYIRSCAIRQKLTAYQGVTGDRGSCHHRKHRKHGFICPAEIAEIAEIVNLCKMDDIIQRM